MLADYSANDPENGEWYETGRADFAAYVRHLEDQEAGRPLPEGLVPCSHRWLIQDGEIVAIVRIRHHIDTPFLREEGGHIGYDVPPRYRGRRFAVAALQSGLEVARKLGLSSVRMFANTDNPASWRTIERCGGVLEAERYSDHYACLVRRYRVDV